MHKPSRQTIIWLAIALLGTIAIGILFINIAQQKDDSSMWWVWIKPMSEPKPVIICNEDIDAAGWLTYQNSTYGFDLKYPKDWILQEKYSTDNEKNVEVGHLIFFPPSGQYSFLLHFAREHVNLAGRTGFGAGAMVSDNSKYIAIASAMIRRNYLIFNNRIKEIYFSKKDSPYMPYEAIESNSVWIQPTFGFDEEHGADPQYDRTLAGVPEVCVAEKILTTFNF